MRSNAGRSLAALAAAAVFWGHALAGEAETVRKSGLPAPPASLTARIPPRPDAAPTGSEFVRSIAELSLESRRLAIHDELVSGNIPGFLRHLKPVELRDREGDAPGRAVIWVMPDYLAVGTDEDFVRVPMGLYTAVNVARQLGFSLPTRKIVDAIQRQADVRVRPLPIKPGRKMTSVAFLWEHNGLIEEQLAERPRGALVVGHKKDLVLTNRLAAKARKVAIYGWHRRDGSPIQPLSTVHESRYADYSHGVRLVSTTVLVEGEAQSLFDLLEDPMRSRLLTYEGPIRHARQIMNLPLTPGAATGPPAKSGQSDR